MTEPPQQTNRGGASAYQREEVDAALRGPNYTENPDVRGVAIATEVAGRIRDEFGGHAIEWKSFRGEVTLTVSPKQLTEVARYVRDVCGFSMLTDLSPTDWLNAETETPKLSRSVGCTKRCTPKDGSG